MRCLFCKQDSSDSKSIEHIIPESLGNTTLILPKGIVCDKCNNYFARKVERPFFDLTGINELRFYEGLASKRGIIPPINGIANGAKIKLYRSAVGTLQSVPNEPVLLECAPEDFDKVMASKALIALAFDDSMIPEKSIVVSRFIAKVALECLAHRLLGNPDWPEFVIDNISFDEIRNYARMGGKKVWPYSYRRIYDREMRCEYENGELGQIIHEEDFLLIPENPGEELSAGKEISAYLFFVMAWFGMEFVINMAGDDENGLEPYKEWLHSHKDISPLYYEGGGKLYE